MLQQRPLYARMMHYAGGLGMMPSLPKADLALVNAHSGSKGALGQASQDASSTKLASRNKV